MRRLKMTVVVRVIIFRHMAVKVCGALALIGLSVLVRPDEVTNGPQHAAQEEARRGPISNHTCNSIGRLALHRPES